MAGRTSFAPKPVNEITTMASTDDQLQALLSQPRETLGVELKRWFDPTTDEGIAKIAKACIALRNNNGGYLLIGFDDEGNPDVTNAPAHIATTYSSDAIQRVVSQFASDLFPVDVQFRERGVTNAPAHIATTYSSDAIQRVVSQFASDLFPVDVQFREVFLVNGNLERSRPVDSAVAEVGLLCGSLVN
jgi:hypothetical protein